MVKIPSGPCRLEAVGRDSSPQQLYATYEGAGKPITVAHEGSQQKWEITPTADEGGYNIRALEVKEHLDQAFMRNEYMNSSVSLGPRQFLRINPDKENNAYYTIAGPYRAGTYGAADWIGVIDGK
ncbi:hypothetical protein FRC11_007518, partial [Ceratobasidium sp. 423]